eukprot:Selendium_serpulae@DN10225_c0_g1_i1.p1
MADVLTKLSEAADNPNPAKAVCSLGDDIFRGALDTGDLTRAQEFVKHLVGNQKRGGFREGLHQAIEWTLKIDAGKETESLVMTKYLMAALRQFERFSAHPPNAWKLYRLLAAQQSPAASASTLLAFFSSYPPLINTVQS